MGRIESLGKGELSCAATTKLQSIAQNHVQQDRIKHIEIDQHFLKEEVTSSTLSLLDVPSEKQLVSVFTKGLNRRTFHTVVYKFGM